MGRGKTDINPVVLKIGFVLACSLGGMIFKFIRNKVIKPSQTPFDSSKSSDCTDQRISPGKSTPNSCKFDPLKTDKHEELHNSILNLSPSGKSNADKDYYLLPEFNYLVKEFDAMKTNPGLPPVKKDSHEQEVNNLKNTVKLLQERERNLENQLLELYGLKEQESTIKELQNRLKLNNMESNLLALKVESLQTDNKRLESQMADYNKVLMDLEDARAKIKALKKKLRLETVQNRERILDLQQRVEKMKKDEDKDGVEIDLDMELNVCKLKDLEDEAEELRKSNASLRVEKIELTQKLERVQNLATSVLEDEKAEKLKKESQQLKKKNEDLTKEIEKLQAERCSDIEQLVYLRWINACLRYELRNHQPDSGKTTARYLSKTLSPKSEQKAKNLILEYAYKEGGLGPETSINIPELDSDQCSSSQSSNENCIDYSLHHKSNHKFFGKLVKLLRGKDDHITAHNHHDHRHHHRQPSHSRNSSLEQVDNLMFSRKQKLMHRHSDVGVCKRVEAVANGGGVIGGNGGGGGGLDSSCSSDGQKSELVKYAEALKDPSPNIRGKYRSRSMSFSSF